MHANKNIIKYIQEDVHTYIHACIITYIYIHTPASYKLVSSNLVSRSHNCFPVSLYTNMYVTKKKKKGKL